MNNSTVNHASNEGVARTGRRRFRRRRRFGTTKQISRVNGADIERLKRKVNALAKDVELKWYDVFVNAGMIPQDNGTPYVYCLTQGINKGTGANNRIGDQIKLTSLWVNIYVHGINTFINECRVRIMIVRYINSNGLLLAPSQLLNVAGGAILYTQAFRNEDFKTSFNILYDSEFDQIPDTNMTATTVVPDIDMIKIRKRLNRIQYYNTGVAGTYADINDGSIWLIATTSGASATVNPNLFFTSRLYYADS